MPNRWFLLLMIAVVAAAATVAARHPHGADGPAAAGLTAGATRPAAAGAAAPPAFRFTDLTGRPAPDFSLTDLQGQRHTLSQLRGKVVMLIFWATWCKTCPVELPHLAALARALGPKGLVTLSVNWEQDSSAVAAMTRGLGIPVLRDPQERTRHDYDAYAVPRVVIVDRSGTIAAIIRGYQGDVNPIALALAAQGFAVPAPAVLERAVPVKRVPLATRG